MKQANDFKNDLAKFDNNLTYIVGFRNLYNICVLMVGFWSCIIPNALAAATGIIIVVLGLKWFLGQCRENIDSLDVSDSFGTCDEQPDYDKAPTSNDILQV
jgi:hypothetical protein